MSSTWSSGLVGDSIQTSLVFGVMIASNAAGIRFVGVTRVQAPRLEDAFEQAKRAAVKIGRRRDFIARAKQGREDGCAGCQAGRECQTAFAFLERRQARFECGSRWIAAARVFVTFVLPRPGLRIGRRRVDRNNGCAGGRVGLLAGVDGAGGEAGFLIGHGDSVLLTIELFASCEESPLSPAKPGKRGLVAAPRSGLCAALFQRRLISCFQIEWNQPRAL